MERHHTFVNTVDTYEPIEEFYSGKSVLITGGTGFLGKVLIEKLLYSCPNITNVYVLARERKNVTGHERIKNILESELFTRLKTENLENMKKVIPVNGDITLQDLGMDEVDKTVILDKVSVVFHLAATVRFNEPLKQAMIVNVEGTRNMVSFAQKMRDLKAFVYMSTAFCNTDKTFVEEIVYPSPMEIDDVYKFLKQHGDDDNMVKGILSNRPNTYTFTKALTESLVADICKDMPTVIIRPSIVVAAMHEPIRGWIDTWLGPTPALDMAARGWLRCFYGNKNHALDIIPVDYVINATMVAAARCRRSKKVSVFNCCTSTINTLSLAEIYTLYLEQSFKVGYNNIPIKFIVFTKSSFIIKSLTIIFQFAPAYVLDVILTLRKIPKRYVKIMKKFDFYCNTTKFVKSRNWYMISTRLRDLADDLDPVDQQKFPCNPARIVWREFIPAYFDGVVRFLVNKEITEKKNV